MKVQVKLTVFFDGTFYLLLFERISNNKLEVYRYVYGKEPKDEEILDFILYHYNDIKYSKDVSIKTKKNIINTKRKLRMASKEHKISNKTFEALRLEQEQHKIIKKQRTKEQKELEENKKLVIHIMKKKEKHKGR